MPSFKLSSGGYTLRLDTVGLTNVAGYAIDPNPGPDQVDIEGTILNPNMFNYQMPTQETPDPSWSVSPLSILLTGETDYDNSPTDDGSPSPPVSGEFVYDRNPVIDVGAGLYSDADLLELYVTTLTPTDIVSNVPISATSNNMLIARDCPVSALGSATYSPVSVVSFQSCAEFPGTEWYRPAEYGWYLLKLDAQSYSHYSGGGDWWWSTIGGSTSGASDGQFCRYNPAGPDNVPDTFDDAKWQEPGGVIDRGVYLTTSHPLAPPSSQIWYWIQFPHGGPSDFPAGQRLRCLSSTGLANGNRLTSNTMFKEGDGLYQLRVQNKANWEKEPPYPWPATIPWLTAPSGDPGETDGGVQDTNLFKVYFKIRLTKV